MSFRSFALFVICTVVFSSLSAKTADNSPLSWNELTKQAKQHYTPVVVLLHQGEDKEFRKLYKRTWKDEHLESWLEGKYLSWSIDVNAPRDGETKIINKVKVNSKTSIVILHPTGYIMGRIDGYVKAEVLKGILNSHLNRTFIFQTRPALTMTLAPEPKLSANSALALNFGQTRGEDGAFCLKPSVKGFEAYALETDLIINEGAESYGLLLFHFSSKKSLKRKVSKVKRFWKGNVWVYRVDDARGNKNYCISIGAFSTKEQARVYAKGLKSFQNIEAGLFSFSQFLEK